MTEEQLDTLARLLTNKQSSYKLTRSELADLLALARVGLAQQETLAKLKAVEIERDELQARIANALL